MAKSQIITQCPICRQHHTVEVESEDWEKYYQPDRPKIQDIFPYLTPQDREMLITGICPVCFDNMFVDCGV